MNQEELRNAFNDWEEGYWKDKLEHPKQFDCFAAGAEWEAEREKYVSVEDAKEYAWEWINKKDLLDVVLDHEDIWHIMADFANTNPTKNK